MNTNAVLLCTFERPLGRNLQLGSRCEYDPQANAGIYRGILPVEFRGRNLYRCWGWQK
jgi:hypothetical protein